MEDREVELDGVRLKNGKCPKLGCAGQLYKTGAGVACAEVNCTYFRRFYNGISDARLDRLELLANEQRASLWPQVLELVAEVRRLRTDSELMWHVCYSAQAAMGATDAVDNANALDNLREDLKAYQANRSDK